MLVSKLTSLLDRSLSFTQTKQIHAQLLVNSLNEFEHLLVRQILNSANPSQRIIQYVESILHHMEKPDSFSVAATIRFLSQCGQFQEAVALYVQMGGLEVPPSTFAISSALKACSRVLNKFMGFMIHGQVQKLGFCKVVYVQTALVDFYSKMGDMRTARKVFDELTGRNVVSWNSILAGYVKIGDLDMAESIFDEMPKKDVISWNSMISGYAKAGNMEEAYASFRQMPQRNSASWNSMISGYIDSGKIELARSFFDAMPQRNNVSYITMISGYSRYGDVTSAEELFCQLDGKDQVLYNAMITCYAQNNRAEEALELFKEMLKCNSNIQPDKMTLASAVSACSKLGDLTFGAWIESYMKEMGIGMDDHLATSFIDLYAKSGIMDKAYELFHGLQKKDLIAYTAMILGCSANDRAKDAIKLFEEMTNAEISPNLGIFTGVLTAYSHLGLLEEGYSCFMSMKEYGLAPLDDHYTIMVDLLGRAGRLQAAHELIQSMRIQPHAGVWGALLNACSLHKNVELAEIAAKHCVELEPQNIEYPLLLANTYADAGRMEDADKLRKADGERGLVKTPSSCLMDFDE